MMFAVIQFCVLLAMSLALPVPDSLLDSTQYFQITAHHVDSVAKYEGFYLSSYAHAPKSGIAYGAFGPGNSTATTCHLVGDVTDFSDHTTELSCDMGYLTVNHFSLLTGNEFPLVFNGTSGSKVIYLDNGLLKVNRPEFDGFYACPTTGLELGPADLLFYRPNGVPEPTDCTSIQLKVVNVVSPSEQILGLGYVS